MASIRKKDRQGQSSVPLGTTSKWLFMTNKGLTGMGAINFNALKALVNIVDVKKIWAA